MLPSCLVGGVQSHMGGGNRRWRGRIDSRGKNLECDWSQFLLPPHKSVIPVDAKGEVGAEPELPAALAGSRSVRCIMSLEVEQNSRT